MRVGDLGGEQLWGTQVLSCFTQRRGPAQGGNGGAGKCMES